MGLETVEQIISKRDNFLQEELTERESIRMVFPSILSSLENVFIVPLSLPG